MIDWLCKGLVELGHEVTLLAPAGSVPAPGVRWVRIDTTQSFLGEVMKGISGEHDVLHTLVPFSRVEEARLPLPLLTTIQGNGREGEIFSPWSVFVSANHARRHGRTAFVHNGVDPGEFLSDELASRRRSGLVFLSKTSWSVKNLRGAAALARKSGVPLAIAGGSRPYSIRLEAAFRRKWKWWGPVSGPRKAEFLASGRAMIFPILWEEPFGIVVVESLLSGTPVLATPRGSLPELLGPEVGRLIPWEDQSRWLETLEDLESGRLCFDSEQCRLWARERFHYRKMAEEYVTLYRRRLAGQSFLLESPQAGETV